MHSTMLRGHTIVTLLMIAATNAVAQPTLACTTRTMFHRETAVRTVIRASNATVWALLTAAADYPRWNSVVTSIEGRIAPGERIVLRSTLDAKRSFTLRIVEFTPNTRLVWGDGKSQRTYEITDNGDRRQGDWMELGGADEQKPAKEGTVEAWGRSATNPVGGWYGLKKGLRGRFGADVPPLMEALGLAELTHCAKANRMRAT